MRLMWHLQRAARLASHQLSWYSLWMFLPPSICDTLRPECCTCSCCDCDCYGNSDGNAHIPWLNQKPAAAATAPSPSLCSACLLPSVCFLSCVFCSLRTVAVATWWWQDFTFVTLAARQLQHIVALASHIYLSILSYPIPLPTRTHTHRFPFPFSIAFLVFVLLFWCACWQRPNGIQLRETCNTSGTSRDHDNLLLYSG